MNTMVLFSIEHFRSDRVDEFYGWIEKNVGEIEVDWSFGRPVDGYDPFWIAIVFRDPEKAMLAKLTWGS